MRLYRALLRLYPASFRDEYRDELCDAFAARRQRIAGRLAPLRQALAALTDVLPNAVAAHAEIVGRDLAYAVRSLRGTPGFALTAILVIALGVGANTAVFSLADLVFLRPLPYAQADRLVKLWQGSKEGTNEVSPANYRDWKGTATSFVAMGAYWRNASNLVGSLEPRRIETVRATPELLPLLGVRPLLGRLFTADEAAKAKFVVLSHALWKSQFGGDPGVLGKSVRLDGAPHTVVGVMPAAFQFPSRSVEAWSSLVLRGDDFADRGDTYLEVVARLSPGVSAERARRELAVIGARLERDHPQENRGIGITLFGLREELSERARLLVLALCGATLCILLLACANLASLLLARGTHRAQELAVRSALGAGRERLVRQLVTESLALALAGGAVGVVAALAGMPLLARLVPASLPIGEQTSLDPRILGLAAAFVLVTGVGFGLAPALRVGRSRAFEALRNGARSGGGRTQRLRAVLVMVEVAASVVLLVTSGLLIRAVWRIQATDPGFRAEGVLTLQTALPLPKYEATARRAQFYNRVLEEVRALPGVEDAAYGTGLPMAMRGGIWAASLTPERVIANATNSVGLRYVTPRWFATLGIPLRRGRDVEEGDRQNGAEVAVISESLARRLWPDGNALEKRVYVAGSGRTVVGVVGDVHVRGLERGSEPQLYLPYRQVADGAITGYTPKDLALRVEPGRDPAALASQIRRIVKGADSEQPVANVRTLAEIVADETASRRTQLYLLEALAAIALLIAGLGIHGLLSFSVSKRSQELGVRRALGAEGSAIVGLVLREGLLLALAGIVVGVAVAAAAARGLGALLFGVHPGDPLTIASAAVLCLATALLGSLRPALRAARVDPLSALRAE